MNKAVMTDRVFIGLGSNLGNRRKWIQKSLKKISEFACISQVSKMRETIPVGVSDQPNYMNGVVEITTHLSPYELLDRLLSVEKSMGRTREKKWAARNIDLDLLIYGTMLINTPALQIPHPRLQERKFVLEPLVELAPLWIHPVSKLTAQELLRNLELKSNLNFYKG